MARKLDIDLVLRPGIDTSSAAGLKAGGAASLTYDEDAGTFVCSAPGGGALGHLPKQCLEHIPRSMGPLHVELRSIKHAADDSGSVTGVTIRIRLDQASHQRPGTAFGRSLHRHCTHA